MTSGTCVHGTGGPRARTSPDRHDPLPSWRLPSVSEFLVQVAIHGPWLTFVTAFLETSFLTGLFVPAGATRSFATVFSLEQGGSLPVLAAVVLVGSTIGDSVGFSIGRKGRTRWSRGPGRLAQVVRSVRSRTASHFGGQPFISVTIPRPIFSLARSCRRRPA